MKSDSNGIYLFSKSDKKIFEQVLKKYFNKNFKKIFQYLEMISWRLTAVRSRAKKIDEVEKYCKF